MAEENKKVRAMDVKEGDKELEFGDAAQVSVEGEKEFDPAKVAIDPKTGVIVSEKEVGKEEEVDR